MATMKHRMINFLLLLWSLETHNSFVSSFTPPSAGLETTRNVDSRISFFSNADTITKLEATTDVEEEEELPTPNSASDSSPLLQTSPPLIPLTTDGDVVKSDPTSKSSSSQTLSQLPPPPPLKIPSDSKLFPVLKQLDGINWEGSCRYVNEQLIPSHNLKLYGGIRLDLEYNVDGDPTSNGIELNSFLLFPNGNRRDIEMRGKRGPTAYPSFRLDPPTLEDGTSGGPIHMVVTEMSPDTILINEVDKATRKIVMTSSLSLVKDPTNPSVIRELIQISHEVGVGAAGVGESVIDGHQVWRFTPAAKQLRENDIGTDDPASGDFE